LAKEDEGHEGRRIHLVVEQKSQLVKQLRREEMGLVDDEEHVAALVFQVTEGGTELGQEAHEAEGGLDLEGEEDFALEGADAQVGVG
jgi:hypothetical protein